MTEDTISVINCEQEDEINDVKIQRLKEKYSQEMRDDQENPIKICMSLVFQAATVKDKTDRLRISHLFSDYITKPNGMINLFLALIDFDPSSQSKTTHQQRFLAVANIVACLPKLCMPYLDYCTSIAKQLKPLLVDDSPKYSSLASVILRSLLESPHNRNGCANDAILCPIIDAMKLTNDSRKTSKYPTYSLAESLMATSNLCRNLFPINKFVPVFAEIFHCYYTILDTPNRLKTALRMSLTIILNDLDSGAAICLLDEALFHRISLANRFQVSSEGDIVIKGIESMENSDSDILHSAQRYEKTRRAVFSLLEESNNGILLLEFFFHIQSKIWNTQCDEQRLYCISMIEPILEEAASEDRSKNKLKNLDLFEVILSNSRLALNLIARTFLNYIEYLRNIESDAKQKRTAKQLIDPSINSCLSIMEILIVSEGDEESARVVLVDKILPILLQIKQLMLEVEADDSIRNLDSMIDRLKELVKCDETLRPSSSHESINTELTRILKDLNDQLVPVRVHAIVRLKHLVMSNDTYVMKRLPHLSSMLESCLADQESYVFLACINLMAEISLRDTEGMLTKLMDLHGNQKLSTQHRLNVGEVLMRLTKQLNKTAPYYASKIIFTLLHSARNEPNELIQISSLTNLGELCRYLGDSLGKYMLDILACLEFGLHSDRSVQLKCACVELLRTALMGVNKFTCESIQRELKSIYSLLKTQRFRVLDDRFVFLVDLALDELDRLAKELLGMEACADEMQSVQPIKKINVLYNGRI